MTGSYPVIVALSARAHAQRIDEWWRENRPKAPDLFARELEGAFTRIAATPLAVAAYRETKGRTIRRLLMPRTSYHVFFEVNERHQKVLGVKEAVVEISILGAQAGDKDDRLALDNSTAASSSRPEAR